MQRRRAVSTTLFLAGLTVAGACESTPPRGPGSILISAPRVTAEPAVMPTYRIRVDGGSPTTLTFFETVSYVVNGLAHGDHVVTVDGLASACSVEDNPRTVRLRGDDTALVVFDIECARTSGDIRVSVTTTGPDPDNGYNITFNGTMGPFVNANGITTLQYVPAGTYSIGLGGVAPNCTGGAAQSVTVTPGATTTVNLTVTCSSAALLRVVTSATGTDRDADGLLFALNGAGPVRATVGTTTLRVAAGSHSWAITDVQPNCTLGEASTGSLTIAPGDTVTLNAALTCSTIGYGVAGTVATEVAGDTLGNSTGNVNAAHDVLQVSTRYASNWLILVLRFARPVGAVGLSSPGGMLGTIDLDVDESSATGIPPLANSYGGTGQQGVDYSIALYDVTADGVRIRRNSLSMDTVSHRAPLALEGDSVVIRVPLAKLGGDDGNMTVTTIIGTFDRPTDIVPNSGVIVARPAGAPAVAAAQISTPVSASVRKQPAATWPPRD